MIEEYIWEDLAHCSARTSSQMPNFLQKETLQFIHLGHERTGGGGLAANHARTKVRSCEFIIPERPKYTAQKNEINTQKKCRRAYYFQVGGSFLVRL